MSYKWKISKRSVVGSRFCSERCVQLAKRAKQRDEARYEQLRAEWDAQREAGTLDD